MTRHEAIQFLKNMIGEENGRMLNCATGFYRQILEYHVEALSIAIACLQHELDQEERGETK